MRILGVAWSYTPRGAIQIGILRVRLQCSVPWIFPKRIQPTEATSLNVRLFVLGDQARNTRWWSPGSAWFVGWGRIFVSDRLRCDKRPKLSTQGLQNLHRHAAFERLISLPGGMVCLSGLIGLQVTRCPVDQRGRGLHHSLVACRTVLCAQGSRKIAF